MVRKSASDLRPTSRARLEGLRSAARREIDTSDIPERRRSFQRLTRDEHGRLPARKSVVRDALKREMERRSWTAYRVWKEAQGHCGTISQSAVHEFLKGRRELELPYAEALLAALHLTVKRART